MLVVFFITLIINCCINWSWIVTKYNLAYSAKPDIDYLQRLDFNIQLMLEYYQGMPLYKTNENNIIEDVRDKQAKDFLSKNFYYEFIQLR